MEIHIGELVRQHVKRYYAGTLEELAAEMSITRQALHNLFKRPHVNTELLQRLSRILNHDFFADVHPLAMVDGQNEVNEPPARYAPQLRSKVCLVVEIAPGDITDDTIRERIERQALELLGQDTAKPKP